MELLFCYKDPCLQLFKNYAWLMLPVSGMKLRQNVAPGDDVSKRTDSIASGEWHHQGMYHLLWMSLGRGDSL